MNRNIKNIACCLRRFFSTDSYYSGTDIGFRLFVTLFFLWNAFSYILLEARGYAYSLGIIPYDIDYPKVYVALFNQLIFGGSVCVSYFIFRRKKVSDYSPVIVNYRHGMNVFILVVANLIFFLLIANNGIILLSGDYFERFENEIPSYYMYLNTAFLLVFCANYRVGKYAVKFQLLYLGLLSSFFALSLFLGSRSYAYKLFICFVYIYYLRSESLFGWRDFINFVVLFTFVYILGQFVNVIRWYAFDFNVEKILLQMNSDSFNELRSYSVLIEKMGHDYGHVSFGFRGVLGDFFSRIIPSFVYDLIGSDRMEYYNSTWTYLSKLIYGNFEGKYGIRLGLVGEIDILLGRGYLFVFGFVYGWLLTIRKYNFYIVIVLMSTIAYGLCSSYHIITTVFVLSFITVAYRLLVLGGVNHG